MIPYGKQSIDQNDIDSVVQVLRSDWLTQGPTVPLFERSVAAYVGAHHGVATNSATSALHVACLALDLGPGDLLWTSPNTFVASANAALYCGAQVDFVDIDPHTYNLSIELLAKKLEQAKAINKLPKVVIPVHYAGQSCDMFGINKLAKQYGFRVIEDASHGIGGTYRNELVGNCQYSDITVFSFHPVKIITTCEGGIALTNNADLAEKMTCYRSHGVTSTKEHMQPRPDNEIWNYQQVCLGYNYRMTDIHAALGLSQLGRLNDFIKRRHEIALRYDQVLVDLPISIPWQHSEARSSYHLYPIRVNKDQCGKTQRQVYDGFLKAGIGINLHYIPVYRQPYYEKMGFSTGYCPEAELFYKEVISIPIFASLSDKAQGQVIDELKKILL